MITKDKLREIRTDMDAALLAVAKRHNLQSLTAAHCVFDTIAGSFTFKVEGITEGGKDKSAALYDTFRQLSPATKLPPRGTKFTCAGRTHEIVGCNTTRSKVLTVRDDGKRFQFPTDAAVRLATPKS